MIYCVDDTSDEPILLLNKHIGFNEEDGMGIDGALLQEEMMKLDNMGKKCMWMYINSIGGNVFESLSILTAMIKTKTPVDTYCGGLALSSAAMLFMGGRNRKMADYAVFMIHNPFNPKDPKDKSSSTVALTNSMVTMIAANSKCDEDTVRKMMEKETWLSAAECLEMGFCTEVESTSVQNKKWIRQEAGEAKAMWKQANKILASSLNPSHIKPSFMAYNKLMAKLQLNAEASEDAAVDAVVSLTERAHTAEKELAKVKEEGHQEVLKAQAKGKTDADAIQAKLTLAETERDAAKLSVTEVQAKLTTAETNLTTITAERDKLKGEKEAAELSAKVVKAKALVAENVKAGRLKNEAKVIEQWEKLATDSYDTTKEMIEAIPTTKKANEITQVEAVVSDENLKRLGSAEMRMLQIAQANKQKPTAVPMPATN